MTDIHSSSTPLPAVAHIKQKIIELQEQLQTQQPGYESLLFTIHKQLAGDEETVHLLSEEEIGVIFAGLSKKKNIIVAEIKSKAAKKTSLRSTTADDI